MKELIKKLIDSIFSLFPLTDTIIFESHPDVSDNAEALFDYFLKKKVNEKYKIVWILLKDNPADYPRENNVYYYLRYDSNIFTKLKVAYILNTAKYIIDSNIFIYKKRKKQIRIHLGHGMPLKYRKEYSEKLGEVDGILITADEFGKYFTNICGVKDNQILSLGLPRNDLIIQKYNVEEFKDKKVIVWMPTYRQHEDKRIESLEVSSKFGLPCINNADELKQLEKVLVENDILLLLRLHPVQDTSFITEVKMKNLIFASDDFLKNKGIRLYHLLSATDALITDYSSVYYDYLLTDKPIGLTTDDIDEYKEVNSIFYDDLENNIIGQYINNFQQLLEFVLDVANGNDVTKEKRQLAKKRFQKYDSSFCERVYVYLKENFHL